MKHIKKIPRGEGCIIQVNGETVLNGAGFPREFTWEEAALYRVAGVPAPATTPEKAKDVTNG